MPGSNPVLLDVYSLAYIFRMTPAQMDAILSRIQPDEVHEAHWFIDVFERWNMPADEADEWRRRIVARRGFLDLRADSSLN